VLENLTAILEAGGSSLDRVLKTTVYLKDLNDFLEMNSVYEMYLGKGGAASPARTTVGVTRLPKDALIEIDLWRKSEERAAAGLSASNKSKAEIPRGFQEVPLSEAGEKVARSEAEWRAELTAEQYHVLREKAQSALLPVR